MRAQLIAGERQDLMIMIMINDQGQEESRGAKVQSNEHSAQVKLPGSEKWARPAATAKAFPLGNYRSRRLEKSRWRKKLLGQIHSRHTLFFISNWQLNSHPRVDLLKGKNESGAV